MAPKLGVCEMSIDILRSSFLKIVDSTPLEGTKSSINKSKNPDNVRNRIALLANSLDNGRITKKKNPGDVCNMIALLANSLGNGRIFEQKGES